LEAIHFDPKKPLPVALLKKIIKLRIKENEQIADLKKLAKPGKSKTKKTIQ